MKNLVLKFTMTTSQLEPATKKIQTYMSNIEHILNYLSEPINKRASPNLNSFC